MSKKLRKLNLSFEQNHIVIAINFLFPLDIFLLFFFNFLKNDNLKKKNDLPLKQKASSKDQNDFLISKNRQFFSRFDACYSIRFKCFVDIFWKIDFCSFMFN